MTLAEARKLPLGLYRVFWKGDTRVSLAAVGQCRDGTPWLAPVNWLSPPTDLATARKSWGRVDKVQLMAVPSKHLT